MSPFQLQSCTSESGVKFNSMLSRQVNLLMNKERDEIDYEVNAIILQIMNQVKVIEYREEGMCD